MMADPETFFILLWLVCINVTHIKTKIGIKMLGFRKSMVWEQIGIWILVIKDVINNTGH